MLVVKVCRILFWKRGWNEDTLQRIGDTMGYGVSGSMMGTAGPGRNGIRSSLDAHASTRTRSWDGQNGSVLEMTRSTANPPFHNRHPR